jgi:CubicO group peptidase (beta-lactamase class C family)
MASFSKQITATLVLQAVDAGKIDLNLSLNHYLFGDAKGISALIIRALFLILYC